MSAKIVKPGSAVTAFLGLVGMSAVAGVLVTAMITPALAVTSVAASNGLQLFEDLPEHLKIGDLAQRTTIYAKDGDKNVQLASFYEQNRVEVKLGKMGEYTVDALIDTEDPRYREHGGIDLASTLRAVVQNTAGDEISGASTITMQYVKNVLVQEAESLPTEEEREAAYAEATKTSPDRKLREMKYAIGVEKEFTKDQILRGYLNIAPFGGQVYGIQAAAKYYFGVNASDLTLPQSATLVGMVNNPNKLRIDMEDNLDRALARRDLVLSNMLEHGSITQEQYDEAVATELEPDIHTAETGCQSAGNAAYFCDYVTAVMRNDPAFGEDSAERWRNMLRGGYKIYTTLDVQLQNSVTDTFTAYAPATLEGQNVDLGIAAVSVEVGTGRILAMQQNKKYTDNEDEVDASTTGVNYNTDIDYGGSSGFQVGSTYKVFTLAEWIKSGRSITETVNSTRRVFQQSTFLDTCNGPYGGTWDPQNSTNAPNSLDITTGLVNSVNTVFATMAQQLDQCAIKQTAEDLLVHRADGKELNSNPSDILGTNEIAPLTMATAFSAIANDGIVCSPIAIDKITVRSGGAGSEDVKAPESSCTRALDSDVNKVVAGGMIKVLTDGYARIAHPDDYSIPIVAKTGTTDNQVDNWLVGASSKVGTAVWVGNAGAVEGGAYPATGNQFSKQILEDYYWNGIGVSTLQMPIFKDIMTAANGLYGGDNIETSTTTPNAKAQVSVPDLSGMSPDEARSQLAAVGLTGIDGSTVDSTEAAGSVAGTSPGAGSMTASGSSVAINISNGSQNEVPNVVGEKESAAKSALRSAGWNVDDGTDTQRVSDKSQDGIVVAQSPGAGEAQKKDEAVIRLTIGVYEKPSGGSGNND